MKKLMAMLCAALLLLSCGCALAESAGANPQGWILLEGTSDGDVITNLAPVTVKQSGSVNRQLEGTFWYYVDEPYIWLLMSNDSRYGVYNYGPYDVLYTVRFKDENNRTQEFLGVVPVGDGMMLLMDDQAAYDRVYYWTDLVASDMDGITSMLRSGKKLQVTIKPKKGGDSFTFTLDTSAFSNAWNIYKGIDPSKGIVATVTAQQVSLRKADGGFISTLPVGAEVLIIGYDAGADMFMVEYNGTSGYLKGAGLSVSRDELLSNFR